MADLSTTYMGLELKNPIIAASSGLTDSVDKIKKLEESGVGAIVLKSIFEEQILREIDSLGVNNMFGTYSETENYVSFYTKEHNLNEYIKLIEDSKKQVEIPIIASINCINSTEWIDFAKRIENSGADAIELNMFILPADEKIKGSDIEQIYFDTVSNIKKEIKIPVALKLSSYFSGMAETMVKLSNTGISALVLFNRFYSPDINIDTEEVISSNIYSHNEENSHNLKWISLLSPKVNCDIASSTGVYTGKDVIKNILVGANAVQLASTLYKNGLSQVNNMIEEVSNWMESKEYSKINDFKGKLNSKNIKNPVIYERAQFMKYYSKHY